MLNQSARVLLIYPPSGIQSHGTCPLGIMMLGAVLEKAGHEVYLLDANVEANPRTNKQII